jgi:hypothetical protein
VEEADETVFWIECLIESGIVKPELLSELISEANELNSNLCRIPKDGTRIRHRAIG